MTRLDTLALVTAIALLASGCAAPAASGTPTSTTAAATESDDAPPPEETDMETPGGSEPVEPLPSGPVLRFTFDTAPVVTPELAGSTDKYVNPGALIERDGVLHLFPNLFSTWPGDVRIPHLTSRDGITWARDTGAAVIDSTTVELADPGIDVSTGYVADDGTWVLIFETVSAANPWVLGRATAPSPSGPWTVDPTPILTAGAAGSWDAGGLHWPAVIRTAKGFLLYYAGFDHLNGTGSIGVATSTDGLHWEKRPEPVLTATEPWELASVDRPRVVTTPNGVFMVYAGRELTDRGLARSDDGTTWEKLPGPSIERTDFPLPGGSWDAALLLRGVQLVYYLEIGQQTTKVYRATLPLP